MGQPVAFFEVISPDAERAGLPGDFGTFAVFADPDGNPVGLWS
jgi:predicted enzyme related to lactoylglutathione lyase